MNTLLKIGSLVCSLSLLSNMAVAQNKVLLIDPTHGNREVVYEDKDGYAVIEGDIIIGTIAEIKKQGAVANKDLNTRWPNGEVPYRINVNMPNKNRSYIQQAIASIEASTPNIRFIPVSGTDGTLPKDYIEFVPSVSTCSSWVGKMGGRQLISLAPGCYVSGSIHEITHALGLWHEQARADRDNYIKIVWDNIADNAKGNFNTVNGLLIGEYDYGSIMHYGPKAFSKNGQDTIIPLTPGAVIGQASKLSPKDVAALNQMYPKAKK